MLVKFKQATVLRGEDGYLRSFGSGTVYDTFTGVLTEDQAQELIAEGLAEESIEVIPSGTVSLNAIGLYDVARYQFAQVDNVKQFETGEITITEDSLREVTVNFSNHHETIPNFAMAFDTNNIGVLSSEILNNKFISCCTVNLEHFFSSKLGIYLSASMPIVENSFMQIDTWRDVNKVFKNSVAGINQDIVG